MNQSTYRQLRHEEAQVPYLYGKKTFISYDDVTSITAKAELARSLGLVGIGFWEISQDDEGELISAAGAVMRNTGQSFPGCKIGRVVRRCGTIRL